MLCSYPHWRAAGTNRKARELSPWLLLFVGAIYLFVAVEFYLAAKYGLCLAFVAYAVSNIGFMIEALRQ